MASIIMICACEEGQDESRCTTHALLCPSVPCVGENLTHLLHVRSIAQQCSLQSPPSRARARCARSLLSSPPLSLAQDNGSARSLALWQIRADARRADADGNQTLADLPHDDASVGAPGERGERRGELRLPVWTNVVLQ